MKFTNAVGAPVMEALTAGTYDGNANCIREYVQNATDSGSSRIEITRENDSIIVIRDYGIGMDEKDLYHALNLGKSEKNEKQAGWRGIGIYSGVPNFHRIYINTRKDGGDKLHVEIDCDKMRGIYNEGRPIEEILEESISKEIEHVHDPAFNIGTEVRLSGVLMNQEFFFMDQELEKFLVSSVPLPLVDTPFTNKLKTELQSRKVNEPAFEVFFKGKKLYREPINPDLFLQDSLTFHEFKNENTVVAIAWFALNKENRELKGPLKGLVFKKKGFTIGDANTVRRLYTKTYHFWSYGEIHIVDPKIKENAGRNNLEITSGNTGWLFTEMRTFLGGLEHTHRYKSSKDRTRDIEVARNNVKSGDYRDGTSVLKSAEKSIASAPKTSSNPIFDKMSQVITEISNQQKVEISKLKKEIEEKKTDEGEKRIVSILSALEEHDAKEVRQKLSDSEKTHEMFNHPMKDVFQKLRSKSSSKTTDPKALLKELFASAFSDNPDEVKKNAKLLLTEPKKIFPDLTKVKAVEANYPYFITSGLGHAIYEFYNIIVNGEKHYSGGLLSLLLDGHDQETKAKAYRDMFFSIEFLSILVDLCTENEKGST